MKETASDILTQQQERLSKIGAYLQQIRVAKGLALTLVARQTKIRATVLQHIEAGELSSLPEPVYVQGLIRRYADCLGVDGQAIAAGFPLETPKPRWRFPFLGDFSLQFQLRPLHLYMLYVMVIVTTVQSLGNVLQTPSISLDPALQDAEVEQAPSDKPQSRPTQSTPRPTALINSTPQEEESVVIDIQTQETAWMRVVVDGETEFEGVVPKGTQRKWVADESIKIRTGNAGAVYITINDEQTPQPLGEPGAVEEFTYQALAGAKPQSGTRSAS